MPNDFIAKFAAGGGPPPLDLFAQILDQAASSPGREAWFATRVAGTQWSDVGICILLAAPTLQAIVAEVIGRSDDMPDEPAVRELYRDHEGFAAWWHIRNPRRVQFHSYDAIPGYGFKSRQGAAYVFGGQAAFVYWDFGGTSFADLAAVVSAEVPLLGGPVSALAPAGTLSAAEPDCELWPRPRAPLHGLDFSGGEEDPRYGNGKIWIANWSPGKDVKLRCGWSGNSADKICRRDLPALIQREPGWWSLDFPFGIAKETARAEVESMAGMASMVCRRR